MIAAGFILAALAFFVVGFMVGHTLKVYRGTLEGLRKPGIRGGVPRTMTDEQLAMNADDLIADLEAEVKRHPDLDHRQCPLDWVICIEEHPDRKERQFVVSVRYMELLHVDHVGSFLEVATFVADTMREYRCETSPDGLHVRKDGKWEKVDPPGWFTADSDYHAVRSETAAVGDDLDHARKRRQLRGN